MSEIETRLENIWQLQLRMMGAIEAIAIRTGIEVEQLQAIYRRLNPDFKMPDEV